MPMGFVLEFFYDLFVDLLLPKRKHRWLRMLLYFAPILLVAFLVGLVLLWVRV